MMSQKASASRSATPSSHVLPIGSGWWCIATSTCWPVCAPSALRRPFKRAWPEPARVLAREERAEAHDRPRAASRLAAELERAAGQDLGHELRVVVVPGNRDHRDAERLERRVEELVTGTALVLNDVAGRDHEVRRPAPVAPRALQDLLEGGVRRHAAHPAVRAGMQVSVADLQDAERGVFGASCHP